MFLSFTARLSYQSRRLYSLYADTFMPRDFFILDSIYGYVYLRYVNKYKLLLI